MGPILDIKNLIAVLLFFVIGILTAVFSRYADLWHSEDERFTQVVNDQQSEHYFTGIKFYLLKNNAKEFNLHATELSYLNKQGKIIFFNPIGQVFDSKDVPTDYKGNRGIYTSNNDKLHLEENTYFKNQAGGEMWADKVDYFIKKDSVLASGNVRTKNVDINTKDIIEINSTNFKGRPEEGSFHYQGAVTGSLTRAKIYEPGMSFGSSQLLGNRYKSEMQLRENVKVTRLAVIATSRNGEIFMENYNKKLKYFVLSDDVKVREKVIGADGKSFIRQAFGEKLEGLTNEGILILTGLPKVIQQGDTIRGNRIIIRENNQVVEVDDSNTNFIIR